jgi:Spx/MgsR family transcriptional regulator
MIRNRPTVLLSLFCISIFEANQYLMSYIIYGLTNCDTTKKARKWFEENNIAYKFHNNKSQPITKEMLLRWCAQVGWQKLLNKKGSAFKHKPLH